MVSEKLIDRATAMQRVTPEQLDQLLHPTVDPKTKATVLATGLPASPGAAQGQVVFSPDEAEELARDEGAKVILVRQETSPDDFHGMVAAQAIVTARGGMTSHAAVVARGMGKPCVSGANSIDIDYGQQQFSVAGTVVTKGDWITVDGSTGRVFLGQVPTVQPSLGPEFSRTDALGRQVSPAARARQCRHAARCEGGSSVWGRRHRPVSHRAYVLR